MATGEIVFSARLYYPPGDKRISHFQVYRMNPDGSGRVQLTRSNWESTDPQWSPDGRRILFWQATQSRGKFTLKLCVMGASGGPAQTIVTFGADEYATTASWHPDGERVLLVRVQTGKNPVTQSLEIISSRVAGRAGSAGSTGSTGKTVRYPDVDEYALSPSGILLYLSNGKTGRLVYTDGGTAAPAPLLRSPLWQDEETLVGLEQGDMDAGEGYYGVRAIVLVGADGKVQQMIDPRTPDNAKPNPDDGPASPIRLARAAPNQSDSLVLYAAHRDIDWYGLVSLTDGTVTKTRNGFKKPVWSPNGKLFVTYMARDLVAYGSKGKQVYVSPVYVGTDMTRPARKITPGLSLCGGVDWRPAPVG